MEGNKRNIDNNISFCKKNGIFKVNLVIKTVFTQGIMIKTY